MELLRTQNRPAKTAAAQEQQGLAAAAPPPPPPSNAVVKKPRIEPPAVTRFPTWNAVPKAHEIAAAAMADCGMTDQPHHGREQRPSEGGGPMTTMKTKSVMRTEAPPAAANLRAE